MKLWRVSRPKGETGWDETQAIVCRARDAYAAEYLFWKEVEGEGPGTDAGRRETYHPVVTEIPLEGESEIILVDFIRG